MKGHMRYLLGCVALLLGSLLLRHAGRFGSLRRRLCGILLLASGAGLSSPLDGGLRVDGLDDTRLGVARRRARFASHTASKVGTSNTRKE
jgi:hypothetical protein